jgi:hypothetical protein
MSTLMERKPYVALCARRHPDAVLQLRRLVVGFPPQRFGFELGQNMWNLWCAKWYLGLLLQNIPTTAPHSLSSNIIRGWCNRPAIASVIMDSVPLHPPPQNRDPKQLLKDSGFNTKEKIHKLQITSLSLGSGRCPGAHDIASLTWWWP